MTEHNYDDILNYNWNHDSLQNRMPLSQRAKIFLPFAALTGFDEALEKTLQTEIAEITGENQPPSSKAANLKSSSTITPKATAPKTPSN